MRRLGRLFLLLAAAAGFVAPLCAAPLRVVGSDLLGADFAAAFARRAQADEREVTLELTGTRPGLARLQAGAADLGLFVLPPDEVPPGDPLLARVIAVQAVVVIVPESVPLTQLTLPQLRGLFAAGAAQNISTWGDLGLTGEWRSRAIVLLAPDPGAALTLPLARRLVFPGVELKPTVALVSALDALPARVLAAGGGIALSPAVPAPGSGLRALALAPSLTEPAYLPTPEHLHGGYALRLPLHVVFRRDAVPRLLPALRWLLGADLREALARAHFHVLPVPAGQQLLLDLEAVR